MRLSAESNKLTVRWVAMGKDFPSRFSESFCISRHMLNRLMAKSKQRVGVTFTIFLCCITKYIHRNKSQKWRLKWLLREIEIYFRIKKLDDQMRIFIYFLLKSSFPKYRFGFEENRLRVLIPGYFSWWKNYVWVQKIISE